MHRFARIPVLLLALFAFVADAIAQNRAPAGGVTIGGKFYKGGQFIPGNSGGFSGFSGGFVGPGIGSYTPKPKSKRAKKADLYYDFKPSVPTSQASASAPKVERNLFGTVVGVIDGDTLDVLTEDKTTVRIRMEGIDAPEKGQPFGTVAKSVLSDTVFGKPVMVAVTGKDTKYNRTLGVIHSGGSNVNKAMVTSGMAWHYKKYNSDPALAAAETKARESRRGLWVDPSPTAPWDWRNK